MCADICASRPLPELFTYWDEHNCSNAFAELVNTGRDNDLSYNPQGQALARGYVQMLFANYLREYQLTEDTSSTSYHPFQERLLGLCTDPRLPGICTDALLVQCSQESRDSISVRPALRNFCGCFVPANPLYVDRTGDAACDPLCRGVTTVQRANNQTGKTTTCSKNVCVIDDITIKATNDIKAINFANICSGCAGNSCICVVGSPNVNGTTNDLGIAANIEQYCGPQSICVTLAGDGSVLREELCTTVTQTSFASNVHPTWGLVIVAAIILLVTLILLVYRSPAA